jgi:hypothetical protein
MGMIQSSLTRRIALRFRATVEFSDALRRRATVEFSPAFQGWDQAPQPKPFVALATVENVFNRR